MTLFLLFLMFTFTCCLCSVSFCGRNSLGLSDVVSLILSGHSGFALSSVFMGPLVVLGFSPSGGSFVGGLSPAAAILIFAAPTYSCM